MGDTYEAPLEMPCDAAGDRPIRSCWGGCALTCAHIALHCGRATGAGVRVCR